MCGGNRLVSVQDVVEKEKKLKIKSLLHLHFAARSVPVRVFFSELLEAGTQQCQNAVFFGENFSYIAVEHDETTLPVLMYIANYAATKMKGFLQCNSCLSLFIDKGKGTFEIAVNEDI